MNQLVRLPVRYFVSYAHKDERLKSDLMGRLHARLSISRDYAFEAWDDRRLIVGEEWRTGIREAIAQTHLGLLLLSPHFFASSFIRAEELPPLLQGTRVIPVALRELRFDGTMDLGGVEKLQVFPGPFGKPYGQQRADAEKDRFADHLFGQIVEAVGLGIPTRP